MFVFCQGQRSRPGIRFERIENVDTVVGIRIHKYHLNVGPGFKNLRKVFDIFDFLFEIFRPAGVSEFLVQQNAYNGPYLKLANLLFTQGRVQDVGKVIAITDVRRELLRGPEVP